MHYQPMLVHSLWEQLWKENLFSPEYAPDLRKHYLHLVDTKLFSEKFIHSLRRKLGIRAPPERHIGARIFTFREVPHAFAAN
ncbi:MAG: hypothetical protein JWM01_429 [Arthrobacter sp.]|nr:hypothetical protein [Arthrobacter sp.]MCU1539482.1 hypothetical protein [Arthrobacter sp.]